MWRGTPTSMRPRCPVPGGLLTHLTRSAAKSCIKVVSRDMTQSRQQSIPSGTHTPAALIRPEQLICQLVCEIFSAEHSIFHLRLRGLLTPTLKSVNCDFAYGHFAQPTRRSFAGFSVPAARSGLFLRPFFTRPFGR